MPRKRHNKKGKKGQPAVRFLDLPTEVLLKILSYLPIPDVVLGARQTCKRLNKVSLMPDLWKHVSVSDSRHSQNFQEVSEDFFLKLLQQRCVIPDMDWRGGATDQSLVMSKTHVAPNETKDASSRHDRKPAGAEGNGAVAGHPGDSGDTALASDYLEVKCVVTSVTEAGEVWPSCSVTDGMLYPSLQQLSLMRDSLPCMDFLLRYPALHLLHLVGPKKDLDSARELSSEDKHVIAEGFKTLKELRLLQVLKVVTGCEGMLDDGAMASVSDYFLSASRLRQVHLDLGVGDQVVKNILDGCPQLRDLRLVNAHLTAAAFSQAAESPNMLLSTLKIKDCPTLDDKCLEAIALAFPCLKKLGLTLNEKVSDEGLTIFLQACSDLIKLNLNLKVEHKKDSSGTGVSDRSCEEDDCSDDCYGFDSGDDDCCGFGSDDDCCGCGSDDDSDGGWDTVEEDDGSNFEDKGGNLDSERKPLSGYCLLELGRKEGKLQKLVLTGFRRLPSCFFMKLFHRQPDLRVLEVENSRMNDHTMAALTRCCPRLHTLHLAHSADVDSAELSTLISGSPQLKDLICQGVPWGSLGDFQKLQELESPKEAAKKRKGQANVKEYKSRLSRLNLCSCSQLMVSGVSALTLACPYLVDLSLTECCLLDDICVGVIMRNLRHLRSLFLEVMVAWDTNLALTDASLHHIQVGGDKLEMLQVDSCRTFTSAAVARTVLHLPRLTTFMLTTSVGRQHTIQHLSDLRKSLQLQLRKLRGEGRVEVKVESFDVSDRDKNLDFTVRRLRSPGPGRGGGGGAPAPRRLLHWLDQPVIVCD